MTRDQARVKTVLERLIKIVDDDEDFATVVMEDLDEFLDKLLHSDAFGTEGQCDPRGDMRDGNWYLGEVQGIDA